MGGLVGSWGLVSWTSRDENGDVSLSMGERPTGAVLYTADGWMSAQTAATDRPTLAGGGWPPTEAQLAGAFSTYMAYCGPYEVRGDTVVHMPVASLLDPDWVGVEQVRFWEISDDGTLVLRAPPFEMRGKVQVSEFQCATNIERSSYVGRNTLEMMLCQ